MGECLDQVGPVHACGGGGEAEVAHVHVCKGLS